MYDGGAIDVSTFRLEKRWFTWKTLSYQELIWMIWNHIYHHKRHEERKSVMMLL